jgi:hypothetical protein
LYTKTLDLEEYEAAAFFQVADQFAVENVCQVIADVFLQHHYEMGIPLFLCP